MAVQKIDYEDKAIFQNDPEIPDNNKVLADNMNEIKRTVNNNADELSTAQENIENLQTNQGTSNAEITTLKNKVQTLENDNITNKQNIQNLETTKVDKEEGKGLISDEEKEKLAGLENYDDTEIKQNIETLNTDISNIKEEQTTQNKKIQEIDDNQIHITTEKASNLNVQDCSGQNAKIGVFGISEQETRSGKNKLVYPYINLSGSIIQDLGNGQLILNGTLDSNISRTIQILNLKAGNYKFLFNNTNLPNNSYFYIRNVDASTMLKTNIKTNTTFTLESDTNLNVTLVLVQGTYSNYKLDLMILEATEEDETFEQYGAMPSPEFKSEIENTGNNINYFDISKITNKGALTNNNDGTLTMQNNSNPIGFIQINQTFKQLCPNLKAGDVITFSFKTTTQNSTYKDRIYASDFLFNGKSKELTQEMLDAYVCFYGGYNEVSIISEIKIEKGTKLTSYSPYNCGNADITVCNKNQFNNGIRSGLYLATNGAYATNENYVCSKEFQNINSSENYVVSSKTKKDGIYYVIEYDEKGNFIKSQNSNTIVKEFKFQVSQNTKKININLGNSNSPCTIENVEDFQLEIDEIASDYIENEQETITFPLQEGQKLYKNDYLADDGIHHAVKVLELIGTEVYTEYNPAIYNPKNICSFKLQQTLPKNEDTNLALSTHFSLKDLFQNNINPEANKFSYYTDEGRSDNSLYFFVNYEDIGVQSTDIAEQKIEKFKNWIVQQKTNGNPVLIYYGLSKENEEIEPYTPEQQEAYNKLQNVLTYKLVTNIFTDKALLEFKYIADTQTYIDNKVNNMQNQLNTINELLSTTKTSAMLLDNMQTDLESEVL